MLKKSLMYIVAAVLIAVATFLGWFYSPSDASADGTPAASNPPLVLCADIPAGGFPVARCRLGIGADLVSEDGEEFIVEYDEGSVPGVPGNGDVLEGGASGTEGVAGEASPEADPEPTVKPGVWDRSKQSIARTVVKMRSWFSSTD